MGAVYACLRAWARGAAHPFAAPKLGSVPTFCRAIGLNAKGVGAMSVRPIFAGLGFCCGLTSPVDVAGSSHKVYLYGDVVAGPPTVGPDLP